MARGWESKDIESQQEAAERRKPAGPPPDPGQQERKRQHDLLLLDRTRIQGEIQRCCHPRRRGQLEGALGDVERRLKEIEALGVPSAKD